MEQLMQLIITVIFFVVVFIVGTRIEKNHYKAVKEKEKDFANLPAVSSKKVADLDRVTDSCLVSGCIVISNDAFKKLVAQIYNIFGGRISVYETLFDRARREAIIRMKEQARVFGADMVVNTRFETSRLGAVNSQNKGMGIFEVLAYGTAVKIAK
ncbi:MAG: heavy metal-binding domain-containing protein [Candidatus Omnitrophota bacterium]